MDKKFTPDAKIIWDSIPSQIQDKLLKNVWCPKCSKITTIINFEGKIVMKDLILTGACTICESKVARLIEGE
ncbi:MAG: hypothetical protein V1872_01545 [bacterium]